MNLNDPVFRKIQKKPERKYSFEEKQKEEVENSRLTDIEKREAELFSEAWENHARGKMSLAELSKRSGVSLGTIYKVFKKESKVRDSMKEVLKELANIPSNILDISFTEKFALVREERIKVPFFTTISEFCDFLNGKDINETTKFKTMSIRSRRLNELEIQKIGDFKNLSILYRDYGFFALLNRQDIGFANHRDILYLDTKGKNHNTSRFQMWTWDDVHANFGSLEYEWPHKKFLTIEDCGRFTEKKFVRIEIEEDARYLGAIVSVDYVISNDE